LCVKLVIYKDELSLLHSEGKRTPTQQADDTKAHADATQTPFVFA
jgi:hypothetical protein